MLFWKAENTTQVRNIRNLAKEPHCTKLNMLCESLWQLYWTKLWFKLWLLMRTDALQIFDFSRAQDAMSWSATDPKWLRENAWKRPIQALNHCYAWQRLQSIGYKWLQIDLYRLIQIEGVFAGYADWRWYSDTVTPYWVPHGSLWRSFCALGSFSEWFTCFVWQTCKFRTNTARYTQYPASLTCALDFFKKTESVWSSQTWEAWQSAYRSARWFNKSLEHLGTIWFKDDQIKRHSIITVLLFTRLSSTVRGSCISRNIPNGLHGSALVGVVHALGFRNCTRFRIETFQKEFSVLNDQNLGRAPNPICGRGKGEHLRHSGIFWDCFLREIPKTPIVAFQ